MEAFSPFPPGFRNLFALRQGRDTGVREPKSSKTSKFLVETENFITEMLNLQGLPRM